MSKVVFWLNIGAAVTAFAAATFWFLSAWGKVPKMVSYWGSTPATDPFYTALVYSVRMNRIAAALSGLTAVLVGVSALLRGA